jgi:hypothetical protein
MFEAELAAYEAAKPELLDREGHYVVIRGDRIVGVFASLDEAYASGVTECGTEQFFLHRIARVDTVAVLSPLTSKATTASILSYTPL